MESYSTAIIGGGAAGIFAAISARNKGESVIICEKLSQIGKKVLASGNGRCNLLNENLDESHYNAAAGELIKSIFDQFGKKEILDYFKALGLQVYSNDGRIFPITNQAASVLRVLEIELQRNSIQVKFNFDCTDISPSKKGFIISAKDGQKIECRKVIITGGGKTYPAFGSDGSMYEVAKKLGHTLIEPVPAVVPLVIQDKLCQILQGQRILTIAKNIIEGREVGEARGELLFTKYGLSGTCILDVSEEISIALNRHHKKEVYVSIDMIPFMSHEQLQNELDKRRVDKRPDGEMLIGILPNKFSNAMEDIFLKYELKTAVNILKNRRFKVSGTRGWNEAEFTSGGINIKEINLKTLESRLIKGIYFAGEVLDVNGKRGGYNLGWAWASGYMAGQTTGLNR